MPGKPLVRKHVAALTILATLGGGCLGAVKTTTRQLQEDALSPVVVPVEQGGKARKTLEGVSEREAERAKEIEEISH